MMCGATRKDMRRARALARESQGWVKELFKYILLPSLGLWLVAEVIPDIRIPLAAVVVFPLQGLWVWWAMAKLAPGLEYTRPILGWADKESIDDLRDDIQDETGVRLTRSRTVEYILSFAYGSPGLKSHLVEAVRESRRLT